MPTSAPRPTRRWRCSRNGGSRRRGTSAVCCVLIPFPPSPPLRQGNCLRVVWLVLRVGKCGGKSVGGLAWKWRPLLSFPNFPFGKLPASVRCGPLFHHQPSLLLFGPRSHQADRRTAALLLTSMSTANKDPGATAPHRTGFRGTFFSPHPSALCSMMMMMMIWMKSQKD